MVDTELQEQDVPSSADVLVDTKCRKEEEPSKIEKYQSPSEIPQSLLTLDSYDLALPNESGANEDPDGQANAHTDLQLSSPKTGDENAKKRKTWLLSNSEAREIDEAGTPEEQETFLREVESFYKENFLQFKAPIFYRQPLNALKLWRAVIRLGGYDVVTSSKLWRQIGESFHPPKTCTSVSYTFRNLYEKALLEYEKNLRKNGDLPGSTFILSSSLKKEASSHQGPGSDRAQRDSAARAMQGWHAQRHVGSGEITEPMVKEKGFSLSCSTPNHKKLESIAFSGLQKHKAQTSMHLVVSPEADKQSVAEVIDIGPLADWVKINVKKTKDSFEVFVLVPGLLRKEVQVQSDPAGKLVITGKPEQLDNPWGITPFKKIVDLSSRIDPLNTSAVMSMHGRLFIRVPFEQCQ